MDFEMSQEHIAICDAVAQTCSGFTEDYWLARDEDGEFPQDFHAAMAKAGWLGVAMPEAYGGSGLGMTEATLVVQTVAETGACMSGASAIHMNIFGLNPIVVFGTEKQKMQYLPPSLTDLLRHVLE